MTNHPPPYSSTKSMSDRQLRMALVIHSLAGGGAERLLSQLATRWAERGHNVHLITLANQATDQYAFSDRVVRHGLDLMRDSHGLGDALKANRQRVLALRQQLHRIDPDFVLSFCDRMNIVTATSITSTRANVWIAEHSDPDRQRLGWLWETWRTWAYRRLSRRVGSGCVVLDDSIFERFSHRFPKLKMVVIPPAISMPSPSAQENEIYQPTDSVKRPRRVLSMGRHSPEKNLSALLHAWKRISPSHPDWELMLAGDGPERSKLEQLAHELRLTNSVRFPGWVQDPWPYYASADIMVLSSLYEGFPVTLLEAMASGVACLGTPVFGAANRLAKLQAIELAGSTSADDIAAGLLRLMENPSLRQQLSQHGKHAAFDFTWDKIGPQWDHVAGVASLADSRLLSDS